MRKFLQDLLKIIGQLTALGEQFGVIFRQLERFNKSMPAGIRQLRQCLGKAQDPVLTYLDWYQVRAGKVAIIMSIFFTTHWFSDVFIRIPQHGLLNHLTSV